MGIFQGRLTLKSSYNFFSTKLTWRFSEDFLEKTSPHFEQVMLVVGRSGSSTLLPPTISFIRGHFLKSNRQIVGLKICLKIATLCLILIRWARIRIHTLKSFYHFFAENMFQNQMPKKFSSASMRTFKLQEKLVTSYVVFSCWKKNYYCNLIRCSIVNCLSKFFFAVNKKKKKLHPSRNNTQFFTTWRS